jgi:hypothetical protein
VCFAGFFTASGPVRGKCSSLSRLKREHGFPGGEKSLAVCDSLQVGPGGMIRHISSVGWARRPSGGVSAGVCPAEATHTGSGSSETWLGYVDPDPSTKARES